MEVDVIESKVLDIFIRNKGLISDADQELLANTTIAIAGLGGDGGLLAERLVRMGVGKLILADPEVFESANINRQFAANMLTLGQNKAKAVADELKAINPEVKIQVLEEGITAENVAAFVADTTVVIDEIEYTAPHLSVLLHTEARKQGRYVFMGANIGWGASVFCFSPTGISFEEYFEYNPVTSTINPLRYLKEVPEYFSESVRTAILAGEMPMPAIASSVSLVAALLSTEVVLFLTGVRSPILAPEFLFVDLFERSFLKS